MHGVMVLAASVCVMKPEKLSKVSAPLIKMFCKMRFSSSMPVSYYLGVNTLPGLFAMLLLEVEKDKDHGKVTFAIDRVSLFQKEEQMSTLPWPPLNVNPVPNVLKTRIL